MTTQQTRKLAVSASLCILRFNKYQHGLLKIPVVIVCSFRKLPEIYSKQSRLKNIDTVLVCQTSKGGGMLLNTQAASGLCTCMLRQAAESSRQLTALLQM